MTSAPRRPLPPSPFGDDDGSADPRVEAALAAFDRGEGGSADVLAALAGSRLLVPVVAVPSETDPDAEKNTQMATVLTTGRDGRRGLLAFTSIETLRRWNPDARPSQVPTRSAAEAALADGADALVIDLAGPVVFAVDARDLRSLASGWRPLGAWPGAAEVRFPAEAGRQPTADPGERTASARRPSTRVTKVRAAAGRVWRRVRRL